MGLILLIFFQHQDSQADSQAALKKIKVKLDLLTDIDTLLMAVKRFYR